MTVTRSLYVLSAGLSRTIKLLSNLCAGTPIKLRNQAVLSVDSMAFTLKSVPCALRTDPIPLYWGQTPTCVQAIRPSQHESVSTTFVATCKDLIAHT